MVNSEIIFLIEEEAEGGYTARALGESIFTKAESFPELCNQVKDAASCNFEEDTRPKVICLHFVKKGIL